MVFLFNSIAQDRVGRVGSGAQFSVPVAGVLSGPVIYAALGETHANSEVCKPNAGGAALPGTHMP